MSLTTTDIDLETVASLFEVQLSERSGFCVVSRPRKNSLENMNWQQQQTLFALKKKKDLETLVSNLVNEAS